MQLLRSRHGNIEPACAVGMHKDESFGNAVTSGSAACDHLKEFEEANRDFEKDVLFVLFG